MGGHEEPQLSPEKPKERADGRESRQQEKEDSVVKESQVVELGDLQKGMKDVVVEGMVPSSSRLNEYAAKSKPSDVLIVVNMLGKDKWHGQNAAANVAGKVGVHSLTTWLRTLYPTPSSWLRCAQAEKAAAARQDADGHGKASTHDDEVCDGGGHDARHAEDI